MSWVDEARGSTNGAVSAEPPAVAMSLPPVVDPRVCFGRPTPVNSPVASYVELLPLCGNATRKLLGDGVTTERDLVTCPDCLKKLQASEPPRSVTPGGAGAPLGAVVVKNAAAPPPLVPTAVLEALDSATLVERIAELTGELAALKVLLKAAKARENARGKARLEPEEEVEEAGAGVFAPDLRAG